MSQAFLRLPSYQLLRRAIVEDIAPLVLVTGSGLSKPAGLPDWNGLKKIIEGQLDDLEYANSQTGTPFDKGLFAAAHDADDFWLFFKLAKKALTPVVFHQSIKAALSSESATPPKPLLRLLSLAPQGLVTLNLDRLSAKAIAQTNPGTPITQIFGTEIARKWHLIMEEAPYLLHLHGNVDDYETWILDSDELKAITSNPAHSLFLTNLYLQNTVLFVGVSPDDIALSRALINLRKAGIEAQRVFWFTNRNDPTSSNWATENNVQLIRYNAVDNADHEAAIDILVDDIAQFRSLDEKRIVPDKTSIRTFSEFGSPDITPEVIATLRPEEARKTLSNILNKYLDGLSGDDLYSKFMEFTEEYDFPIQTRAFYVAKSSGNSQFFEYKLNFPPMGKGNFGTVYQANDATGLPVAVKIMHNSILHSEEMLGGFRRGSASMKILTDNKVKGVAGFVESFEMPPTIVMEFVAGNSLSELFVHLSHFSWRERIRMISEIANIVDDCHKLPQSVLHRDIKPSNIMIDGVDYTDYTYERLTVLDFDMSWHKGSSEKDVVFESRDDFGYLSPEQTDPTKVTKSRSAKVDSYGLGMTAYAVLGGLHPIPNAPLDARWRENTLRAARSGYHGPWRCLPYRLSRFIFDSTAMEQVDRLEFSNGRRRLEKIASVALGLHTIAPIDVVAEEILAMLAEGISYDWNDVSDSGMVQFAGGTKIECGVDLKTLEIAVKITYQDVGGKNYANRNALMGEFKSYVTKLFTTDGYKQIGSDVSLGNLSFDGRIKVIGTMDFVSKVGESILGAVKILHRI